MGLRKLLPVVSKLLGLLGIKVNSNAELRKEKLRVAHKGLMVLLLAFGLVILIDNVFSLGAGSFVYDFFQIILEYFIA